MRVMSMAKISVTIITSITTIVDAYPSKLVMLMARYMLDTIIIDHDYG